MLQSKSDIDNWHEKADPWGYEASPDDLMRKEILLSEVPSGRYERVLDIGCGQGFITRDLPGESILGVDISEAAINHAKQTAAPHISYLASDLFNLPRHLGAQQFDLVVITGVMYPQYIGHGSELVKMIVDSLLKRGGVLVSVHISDWYRSRFRYPRVSDSVYFYRNYHHLLEVYRKWF
jgi:predicted TPR repeat methyltransferase